MTQRESKNHWPWLNRTLRDTRWSLVARVRKATAAKPGNAGDEFAQCYWYPLYSYLRRTGYSETDAQDHVQSFLLRVLDDDLLAPADPEKGHLRSYLVTLLNRYIASRRRRENAQKRGGGTTKLPLEWATAEVAFQAKCRHAPSPDEAYRLAFASRLVADGIAALRRHYAASGQSALCEELLPALEGSLPDGTYDEAATRLGMRPGTVRAAAIRMRERFRLAVRDSAAVVLGLPVGPALDAELRDIFCSQSMPTGL